MQRKSDLLVAPSTLRHLLPSLALLLSCLPSALCSNSTDADNPFSFGLNFAAGNGFEHTLAVLLIIFGVICIYFGVRLFKVAIFGIAWICIGGLVYYIAMIASDGNSKTSFTCGMIFGVLGGLLAVWLVEVGLIILGGFCVFVLWECFITLFPHAVPSGGIYTVLAVVLIGGAILSWFFQQWVLLIVTPIIGTFLFSQGLSKYVHNSDIELNVFDAIHGNDWCNTRQCLGLYAGFVGIAASGYIVQWYITSGLRGSHHSHHHHHSKKKHGDYMPSP